MLHAFFEKGEWFAAKRYGYGIGRPIAWQGWVLMLAYIGAMLGVALTLDAADSVLRVMLGVAGIVVLTILFLVIAARRTRGGIRWRWGAD